MGRGPRASSLTGVNPRVDQLGLLTKGLVTWQLDNVTFTLRWASSAGERSHDDATALADHRPLHFWERRWREKWHAKVQAPTDASEKHASPSIRNERWALCWASFGLSRGVNSHPWPWKWSAKDMRAGPDRNWLFGPFCFKHFLKFFRFFRNSSRLFN
jgi:hypothetical protein